MKGEWRMRFRGEKELSSGMKTRDEKRQGVRL